MFNKSVTHAYVFTPGSRHLGIYEFVHFNSKFSFLNFGISGMWEVKLRTNESNILVGFASYRNLVLENQVEHCSYRTGCGTIEV